MFLKLFLKLNFFQIFRGMCFLSNIKVSHNTDYIFMIASAQVQTVWYPRVSSHISRYFFHFLKELWFHTLYTLDLCDLTERSFLTEMSFLHQMLVKTILDILIKLNLEYIPCIYFWNTFVAKPFWSLIRILKSFTVCTFKKSLLIINIMNITIQKWIWAFKNLKFFMQIFLFKKLLYTYLW